MKRFINLLLISLITMSLALSGCGQTEKGSRNTSSQSSSTKDSSTQDSSAPNSSTLNNTTVTAVYNNDGKVTKAPEERIINFWSYTHEIVGLIEKFKELHRDFGYKIMVTDLSNSDVSMQTLLDKALAAGSPDAPDIYAVESSYAVKYTQGEACQYAAAYKDLGIDVDNLLKEASIAKYVTDLGTNPEGQVVGLGYQSMAGAFIYRRSIAKKVWKTDDPSKIKEIIGPGWDKFLSAAADLKAKGYPICSSLEDIWQVLKGNTDQPWVVNGELFIDPKRMGFMDFAMKLKKSGYLNNNQAWTDGWYSDIKNEGRKKVFGFFGPSWFANYIILPNCGGKTAGEGTYGDWAVCESPSGFYWGGTWVLANKDTRAKDGVGEILKWMTLDTSETGLQYLWANGKLESDVKDAVNSAAVMEKSDGSVDFLGGQNPFDVFVSAGENATGKNVTKYDDTMSYLWIDQVREYIDGKKSKEQAIADFKKQVADNLDVDVE